MASTLEELQQQLLQGAQASGNLAGLDERYERANALRDQPIQEMRGNATGTGLSAIANLMNSYTGNKRAAAIEPQRATAREQMAGAKNALPMYQAQKAEEATALAAQNRLQDQGIAEQKGAQAQANFLQTATALKESQDADRLSREEVAAARAANSVKPTKEFTNLKESRQSRLGTIDKGAKLLKAFNSGAESGTSRAALNWVPGQFTDQAGFDQELDAYAEQAARAMLKSMGEIRPTDADVEGAKKSLFGIGKGEQVNINLLGEYLDQQVSMENRLLTLEGAEPMVAPDEAALPKGTDWYGALYGDESKRAEYLNQGQEAPKQGELQPMPQEQALEMLSKNPQMRGAYVSLYGEPPEGY
tara:strand:+ start:845 stop:1924 length:1080 start_codon:yes stop_codon:yes gene_type:complete